ncbi:MAG: alpha/beta hydrolase [Alphaproteobacteria bacterium]|nr:alpha/beta hydrolase [Alphaproteobacteria bacterium]
MSTDPMAIWRTPPGVRRDYVGGRYGQVHYRVALPKQATRRPLLCLHSTGFSGRMFALLMAELARERVVLAMDSPGFGESDPPATPPTVADLAAAHIDFLHAVGIGEVDVLSYHGGTKTAVEMALQRPQQVKRLLLTGVPLANEAERTRARAAFLRPDFTYDGSFLQRRWGFSATWRKPDVPLICVQKSVAETLRPGFRAWWGARANFDYRLEQMVPRLTQPHRVLNPDDDLTQQTQRIQAHLTHGDYVDLPQWAHFRLDTRTAEFAGYVRDYFDAGRPGSYPAHIEPAAAGVAPYVARRAFVPTPNGPVHVRMSVPEIALAPPLILLHLSTLSGRVYDALMSEMGRDRIVVAVDTPGFGESEAPTAQPAIADFAHAVGAAIDALGLGRADVMGYHTGSVIAVELALQRASGIRKVVMISAPIFTQDEIDVRLRRNGPEELREDGSHLVERWRRMADNYGPRVSEDVFLRNFAESMRGGPVSFWGHYAVYRYPLAERLGAVAQPVLILRPNDDAAQLTLRARGLMRQGRIHDLMDYGFYFMDAHPREVGALLRDFLDRE